MSQCVWLGRSSRPVSSQRRLYPWWEWFWTSGVWNYSLGETRASLPCPPTSSQPHKGLSRDCRDNWCFPGSQQLGFSAPPPYLSPGQGWVPQEPVGLGSERLLLLWLSGMGLETGRRRVEWGEGFGGMGKSGSDEGGIGAGMTRTRRV